MNGYQAQGFVIGRDHVRQLMRLMGLEAIYPKQRLSLQDKENRVYPYLLRGMDIVRPDQVWATDITYVRLRHGFAYLVAVMDWFSRYVLSWEVSLSMEGGFCVSALKAALAISKPEIFNSDQGSQFTSGAFTQELLDRDIRISMDGKGRAFDTRGQGWPEEANNVSPKDATADAERNIMIERLWRTVKYEEVFLKDYGNIFEARDSLGEYLTFYNEERRHSGLGGKTPAAMYWSGRENMVVAV